MTSREQTCPTCGPSCYDDKGRCVRCTHKAFLTGLLARLSREVAPSVPYAPKRYAGHDKRACRCGPHADLRLSHKGNGDVWCKACDRPAPGAVQVAYLYLHATERPYDPETWYGLKRCPMCKEPGLDLRSTADVYDCLACGEAIDRGGYKAYLHHAIEKEEEAAWRARERAWRHALGDLAGPPVDTGSPRLPAAEAATRLDAAAALLAQSGLSPRGPR